MLDSRDPGRGRAGVPVPADRSRVDNQDGGAAGRQHPGRLPLPYRPWARVHRSARRRLDDGHGGGRPPVGAAALAEPRSCRAARPGLGGHAQAARRRVSDARQEGVRDREPLQLEGRRRAAVRPLPAADPLDGGRPACAGSGRERLRRRAARGRPGCERHRARGHQRLRVLGDGGQSSRAASSRRSWTRLRKAERYSYVFEGNSQVLDQILVSENLLGNFGIEYDPVHVNAEFADQAPTTTRRSRGSTSAVGRRRSSSGIEKARRRSRRRATSRTRRRGSRGSRSP